MKKLICLFLLMMMTVLLIACHGKHDEPPKNTEPMDSQKESSPLESAKKITVLEMGVYDHAVPANHQDEIFVKSTSNVDKDKVGTTAQVLWGGKNVIGTYQETSFSGYYHGESVKYSAEQDGVSYEFAVDFDGNLKFMIANDKNHVVTERKSRDECFAIAKRFLETYEIDLSAYELDFERHVTNLSVYESVQVFVFTRKISDIWTNDSILVGVSVSGDIYTMRVYNQNSLDGIVVPTADEWEKIEAAVEQKLEKIYGNQEKYTAQYSLEDAKKVLCRLEDGRYAVQYEISVSLTSKNSQTPFDEKTCLLVTW